MFLTLVSNEIRAFLNLCIEECRSKTEIESIFDKCLEIYSEWVDGPLVIKLKNILTRMSSEDIRISEVVYAVTYTYIRKIKPKKAQKIATYVAIRCDREINFEIDFDYIQCVYREW